uniref:Uncharacterized protein n=2 Tax=Spongospora subterranea TaxID=70186 RepID=A0A0H5QJP1_9EUKA|eukprot:CRZ01842.1 hypothetical protein [Spongospora subterranea]
MIRLPLDPALSVLLVKSIGRSCVEEMITVAATITAEHLWVTPRGQADEAEAAHARFRSSYGDHITAMVVYDDWVRNGRSQNWADDNYVNGRALQTASMVRRQLSEMMKSARRHCSPKSVDPILECRKIIAQSLFDRCVHRVSEGLYRPYRNPARLLHQRHDPLFGVHFQSSIRCLQPKWVVYGELSSSNNARPVMRRVTVIEIDWISNLLPRLQEANTSRLTGHTLEPAPKSLTSPAPALDVLNSPKRVPPLDSCAVQRVAAARQRFAERKRLKTL